ncbi:hypothetical protein F442_05524 [Phytophthora nicotianae P10297]|uniref:PX domain-containing protein n=1 Tax=Phytophthora nicotianae P10297 TaxID=1317064 RepID=W2ZPC3_PHYNI|nr:hypothetical protein F442_05524 [Phytophthora nicotianae P10297]
MKTISAHVTGFYRSSFHAYTTEVNVDGHRWRLGLRYSKFHEFYGELVAKDSDFHADFPPKGTLFFTPKPEERQEQLDVFLQQVLAYYAAKGHPAEIEDLLCDLLKVPRHLKSPEHEDDDVSTSTESVLDEPMHEPPSPESVVSVEAVDRKEEMPQVAETKVTEQAPVQEAMPESQVAKEEVVATPEPMQPANPVAEEPRPVEKTEAPIAHEQAKAQVETPAPAEKTELVKEMVEKEINDVEKVKEETKPIAAQIPVEKPVVETKTAADEETIVAAVEPKMASSEEQPVAEPIERESAPPKPQDAEKPATCERTPPNDKVEYKELATSGRVSSWIAACLPKSLLGFIRHRCMKKTNLVVLCVALLLPMVLARR